MSSPPDSYFNRLWIYQNERFPIFAHGLLIAVFSYSAVSFSFLLRTDTQSSFPLWSAALVAFVSSFFSFFHLRIADEFKDIDEDTRYRPYRPVPRGLIQLKELGWLWITTGILQVALAFWLDYRLVLVLLMTWIYLALMSREFFAREWLKARPFTYLWTHMLIMPLIDFYATSCDWMPVSGTIPPGLFWFVIVSFFNGVVIEIGRKIRAPEDEEDGVPTYSVIWGRKKAVSAWILAMALTALSGVMAASLIGFTVPAGIIYLSILAFAFFSARGFLKDPASKSGERFENLSGLWTLSLYLSLGALPLAVRVFSS